MVTGQVVFSVPRREHPKGGSMPTSSRNIQVVADSSREGSAAHADRRGRLASVLLKPQDGQHFQNIFAGLSICKRDMVFCPDHGHAGFERTGFVTVEGLRSFHRVGEVLPSSVRILSFFDNDEPWTWGLAKSSGNYVTTRRSCRSGKGCARGPRHVGWGARAEEAITMRQAAL